MKIYGLIAILFLTQSTFSQSISSYLINAEKYDRYTNISKIIETTSFYDSDNIKKEIEYKDFDSSMNLISLKRFNDKNKLIFSRTYEYDSLHRQIVTNSKTWINTIGYVSEYSIYKYDSHNNCIQIDYSSHNQVLSICKYYFENKYNLIRLETFDANGRLFGYETAQYDLENNKMEISQFNSKNELLNSNNRPIKFEDNYKQNTSGKYNEHNNLIYQEIDCDDNICYITDYKYDQKGNWISEIRHRYIKTKKGKLKRKKLVMVKTRDIKYNTDS